MCDGDTAVLSSAFPSLESAPIAAALRPFEAMAVIWNSIDRYVPPDCRAAWFDRCTRSPDPEHAVDARAGRAPCARSLDSLRKPLHHRAGHHRHSLARSPLLWAAGRCQSFEGYGAWPKVEAVAHRLIMC